ncbi:hypothetical protein [Streptomyces orinoci]|uniref:Uncharacterized protein n=1 Tax=Streptomyces orinoci TaxID=67339 RepID=A0ABV3K0A3_STRON|nr:hypothetical protein [Streptomyces orinoci]
MPESLAHGHYRRDHDAADPEQALADLMAGQVEHPTPVFGAYEVVSQQQAGLLTVTGVYGTVLSPVTARDEFLQILDRRDNEPRTVSGPRTITPPGSQEPLQCRVIYVTHPDVGDHGWDAECTWADAATVATVREVLLSKVRPDDVDLDALAREVNAIRNDVRAS